MIFHSARVLLMHGVIRADLDGEKRKQSRPDGVQDTIARNADPKGFVSR